jgi:hypothetical protein
MGKYDGFELTAAKWLTETVNVYKVATDTGMGGARQNGPLKVITGLKASIQPRSAFATHNVMGWMPEQSHAMFCKAVNEDGVPLDIRLGYEIEETKSGRWFKVIGPPEPFNDPATSRGHHLEIAVKTMAKF